MQESLIGYQRSTGPSLGHQEERRALAAGLMKPMPAAPSSGPLTDSLQSLHQGLLSLEDRITLLENRLGFYMRPSPPNTLQKADNVPGPPAAGIVIQVESMRMKAGDIEARVLDILGRLDV